MTDPQYFEQAGRRLAYCHRLGAGPTIMFLPGYMSDMSGSKAVALDLWAANHGRAMLRFDYSGCGASDGRFEDATLDSWKDDVLALVDHLALDRVVLVGSSMGGWLMLLAALARPERVAGLLGIAAAPDFTDWAFDETRRQQLERDGRIEDFSPYGPEPTITTHAFYESGMRALVLDAPLPLSCPVRLLHGQEDSDVPWELSLRLAARLQSTDVRTTLIKDGDHRLSRDSDIALLCATLSELMESL